MNDHPHKPGDLPAPSQPESSGGTKREILELANPIITLELRKNFHVSLRSDDLSETNQDALEIMSEVRLRVLRRIESAGSAGIENLSAYIRAVASNAFRDHLRKKYPARLRLSNRVRYILNNTEGLSSWLSGEGDVVCGLSRHEGSPAASEALPDGLIPALEESGAPSQARSGGERVRLLVLEFFAMHPLPVPLPVLISVLTEVLKIVEPRLEAGEDAAMQLPDGARSPVRRYEDRSALEDLWELILELPLRHRTAVLLNLRTQGGDNALMLFPALGIASVRGIAEALGMDAKELAEIWEDLPLDDYTIAERLGLTRQQVINLRQSARVKLKKERD